jgi:hypothetical protein
MSGHVEHQVVSKPSTTGLSTPTPAFTASAAMTASAMARFIDGVSN